MELKPVYYSSCLVFDQRWSALVLGLTATSVCIVAWNYSGTMSILACLLLVLLTIWYIFVPIKLEINSLGIVRTLWGHKRLIRWGDIRGYQIRHNGLLLLSQRDRFPLDPFCALFLPVPKGLMTEVLYRFRLHIGE